MDDELVWLMSSILSAATVLLASATVARSWATLVARSRVGALMTVQWAEGTVTTLTSGTFRGVTSRAPNMWGELCVPFCSGTIFTCNWILWVNVAGETPRIVKLIIRNVVILTWWHYENSWVCFALKAPLYLNTVMNPVLDLTCPTSGLFEIVA